MIDRTLKYVLEDVRFKTLGAGRTDAMVSANEAAFELFIYKQPLEDLDLFLERFNFNLPQDIRALSVEVVSEEFNVIHDSKFKEYHYLFSFGQKNHPFCAPIMTGFQEELNIEAMKEGAHLFQGTHNFRAYCYKATEESQQARTIDGSEIIRNNEYSASFFPEISYLFRVSGKGFGRNQIRMMMGALIRLGNGDLSLSQMRESLVTGELDQTNFIAPASGLILHSINY
jgi:tRNA pseudouridine38-40 synthase